MNCEIEHKSKTKVGKIRNLVPDLYKVSFTCKFNYRVQCQIHYPWPDVYIWCPGKCMKDNKMGNTWHTPIVSQKSDIQSFHPTPLRKGQWRVGSLGMVVPATMLKLPQNWIIWKQCVLMKKLFMKWLNWVWYRCMLYVTYTTSGFYSNTFRSGRFCDRDWIEFSDKGAHLQDKYSYSWGSRGAVNSLSGSSAESCKFCDFSHLRLSQMQFKWPWEDNFAWSYYFNLRCFANFTAKVKPIFIMVVIFMWPPWSCVFGKCHV